MSKHLFTFCGAHYLRHFRRAAQATESQRYVNLMLLNGLLFIYINYATAACKVMPTRHKSLTHTHKHLNVLTHNKMHK